MPPILMAFVNRVAQMLAARNPGAAELMRDTVRFGAATRSFGRRLGWLGGAASRPSARWSTIR